MPGIHPKRVRTKTIKNDPHPLSATAKGGSRIQSKARQKLIFVKLYPNNRIKIEKKKYP
jgi:hypothetical protein